MSALEVTALVSALTLSTTLLVVVVAAVWWFDRYDREPLHLVVGVFLWGALAAPVLSVASCSLIGFASGAQPHAVAGWLGPAVEEIAKALGLVLLVFLSREFDNPTDGVVYGTAVGLGFAATENLVYTVAGADHLPIGDTLLLVVIRTALSAGIHAVASATVGGCFGFAYLSRRWTDRAAWGLGGLAAAIALHSLWNLMLLRFGPTGPSPAPWFAVLPLLYALYVVTLVIFLRSERRILQVELAEEARLELVPPWVPEVIPFYRRRIRSAWWPSRRERTVLARLLTRLAFRKHAVARLPEDEAHLAGLEVMRLRQRIRRMLGTEGDCQSSVEGNGTEV